MLSFSLSLSLPLLQKKRWEAENYLSIIKMDLNSRLMRLKFFFLSFFFHFHFFSSIFCKLSSKQQHWQTKMLQRALENWHLLKSRALFRNQFLWVIVMQKKMLRHFTANLIHMKQFVVRWQLSVIRNDDDEDNDTDDERFACFLLFAYFLNPLFMPLSRISCLFI